MRGLGKGVGVVEVCMQGWSTRMQLCPQGSVASQRLREGGIPNRGAMLTCVASKKMSALEAPGKAFEVELNCCSRSTITLWWSSQGEAQGQSCVRVCVYVCVCACVHAWKKPIPALILHTHTHTHTCVLQHQSLARRARCWWQCAQQRRRQRGARRRMERSCPARSQSI